MAAWRRTWRPARTARSRWKAPASSKPRYGGAPRRRRQRARWRSDQFLDVGFNVAIVLVVVSVVAGVWMLVNRTGIVSVSGDAVNVFGSGFVLLARRVAPALPLYAGAAALLVSALAIWWWAERDAAL